MTDYNTRDEIADSIVRRITDLNEQSLTQLAQYISYLKWQEEMWSSLIDDETAGAKDRSVVWTYDFLEGFPAARQVSTREPDIMEIQVGPAQCGMVQQLALWEHPPAVGSAVCQYELEAPAEVDSLRMRFAVGIRDGALMEGDNLCAFRILVDGRRLWSATKQSNEWERYIIDLPTNSGQSMVVQFVTDALGDSRWNWAVWAEPQLLGYSSQHL